MFLRSAHIRHVKNLSDVQLDFNGGHYPGWHVILGDNGTGKSTLIRALALALVGPREAMALREDWSRWTALGQREASVTLKLTFDDRDAATGGGAPLKSRQFEAKLTIAMVHPEPPSQTPPQAELSGNAPPNRYLWGTGRGWFSASFGPARRFTGGNGDYQRIFFSNPRVARHLSAFSEQVALSEALLWLVEKRRAGQNEYVAKVTRFLNGTHLLPHDVTLHEVTDQTLRFRDGEGVVVDATELSDGYRSILSLALELIRQMEVCYGPDALFSDEGDAIVVPGVVLIDEIDSHLHPSWQATVGDWFTQRFPQVQFLIATHSALVCRSIGETGRVFRLRAPGLEGPQLTEITGEEREKLWYGSLQRALESEGFSLTVGRSALGRERLRELGELNRAALDRELNAEEIARRALLSAVLADVRSD